MKIANLVLRFLLELCALAAVSYWVSGTAANDCAGIAQAGRPAKQEAKPGR